MEKYYGNYRGIVISDADPLEKNRVKVFVPQISAPLLSSVNLNKNDISFRSLGINTLDSLSPEIIESIEPLLPWAEYAAPLFGGGSSAHYNPTSKLATNTSGTAWAPPTGSGTGNYAAMVPGNIQSSVSDPSPEYHKTKDQDNFTDSVSSAINPGIRKNLEIFVTAIGYAETGWEPAEAYRDTYNKTASELRALGYSETTINKIYNRNVDKNASALGIEASRKTYGDYGFLQTNLQQTSVKSFNGDPRSINGIGLDTTSRAAQLNAGIEYIRVKFPTAYSAAARGDFEKARQICAGCWFGLKDKKDDPTFKSILSNQSNSVQDRWLSTARDSTAVNVSDALAQGAQKDRGGKSTTDRKSDTSVSEGDKIAVPHNAYKAVNDLAERNNYTPLDGMPGGLFSTPKPGAHVWIFFEGGDPMYPVYFAQHIVTEDIARVKQRSSSGAKTDVSKDKQRIQTSQIVQPGAGNLEFITQVWHDEVEGDIDESGIRLSCQGGGLYQKMSSGTVEYSPRAKSATTDGDEFHSVYGDHNKYTAGADVNVVNEDFVLRVGKITPESQAAAADIYKALEPIHNKRRNRIVPTGSAPCPNCNRTILSTKGDGLVSTLLRVAGKAIDKILPRKGTALDFITEILTVSLKPIRAEKQKKLMNTSSCGPNCTNHTVPTYTGPGSSAGDEEYVDSLVAVKDKIHDLEKKTGFGGDYTIEVAKNATLVVGLATNTLEPFREIPDGAQVANGIEFYKGKGSMGFKSNTAPQYEPLEMVTPDLGNYDMLIGNKLHIKVGGGGFFTETTGQVNIHGGSIEMTGNSIVLGNNKGITKVNGSALQLHAQSIELGESAANVHVFGSMHCAANINTMGAVYSQGGIATCGIDVPYETEKTSTTTSPDYAGETAKWLTTGGPVLKTVSAAWKSLMHYSHPGQIGYLATSAGINDLITEQMSLVTSVLPVDGLTGIGICAVGPVTVFNFPHVHPTSSTAHYHSYQRPRGTKISGADTVMDSYALNGTATPNVIGLG